MRNHDSLFEFRPSLIGVISTIGATAIGAPIDTQGFKDVLAVLVAGAIQGSSGASQNLAVKIQESANPLGTNWTDVTNGAYHAGSWDFDTLTWASTTTGTFYEPRTQEQYERVGDGVRQRYIRAHATLSGTAGLGPKFAVVMGLARHYDSAFVLNAVTQPTGNAEYSKLL
jgi:hypothetical protein